MGIARPLPNSEFFNFSSAFFDDGMKRFDRRRLLREVVGVDDGVGRSFGSFAALFVIDDVCRLSIVFNGAVNFVTLLLSDTNDRIACCDVPRDSVCHFCVGDWGGATWIGCDCCFCSVAMNSALMRIGMWWLDADNAWCLQMSKIVN